MTVVYATGAARTVPAYAATITVTSATDVVGNGDGCSLREAVDNANGVHTEGNVVEVHQDQQPPYVVIANRDGFQKVVLLCGGQCPTIQEGDYLEADGEKQSEALFEATDVDVKAASR